MNYKTDYFASKDWFYFENNEDKILSKDELRRNILSGENVSLSKKGLSSYFVYRYPIMCQTMFDGIKRLDAGQQYSNNEISYYWKPNISKKDISEQDAMDKIIEILKLSIKELVGDKEVIGFTLSGGLDSSLLLSLTRNLFPNRKIYTYTAGFYGDDEFEYARIVADLYSDKHQEIVLGKEDFLGENSIIKELIKLKMAPLHPNELPLAVIEKEASIDGCQIVLNGEGADDIFGGFGHNMRMLLKYEGEIDNNKDIFEFILSNYSYFSIEDRKKILNDKYNYEIENVNVLLEEECPTSLEDKMFYFIQRLHTRGLIERGVNALRFNNIKHGFPFIDSRLVNFANSLPFDYKVRAKTDISKVNIKELSYKEISNKFDEPKYILKKASEEYLPHTIIYREKKAFPVPYNLWLKDLNEWDLNKEVFKIRSLSGFTGWEKFMIINLDIFIKLFIK